MLEARLYVLQRLSAGLMAPLVFIHLGVMIYAIQGGLSADEILGRTQGNLLWAGIYGFFVVAVATHAAIGVRNILREWVRLRGLTLNTCSVILFTVLLLTGLRAVYAVVAT